MTFCIGIKVKEGLVGIADTRITSGTEMITAKKVSIHSYAHHSMFIMTSGLRSVRDKAITYFDEVLEESNESFDKLYKAATAFALQLRRVAAEDKKALEESHLRFNVHALVGGQLENDSDHKLYLLYPEGNWVEVSESTPYYIIGESGFGKPLLDRVLSGNSSLEDTLLAAYLAFDATRTSANDVDFPIDVVVYQKNSYHFIEKRFKEKDLISVSDWWMGEICRLVKRVPADWVKKFLYSKHG